MLIQPHRYSGEEQMNPHWRIILAMLMLAWAGTAQASSDATCYPEWKVKHGEYKGCSGTALLSPGNDTRINLLMLLHDRHGAVGPAGNYALGYGVVKRLGEAEPFDWTTFAHALTPSPAGAENKERGSFPFGTRCMSNMVGSAEFIDAVSKAKGLTAEERATLTAVRVGLNPQCSDAKAASISRDALALVKSKAGRAFAEYLTGAASFYDGDFETARQTFVDIGKANSSWLAEARAYMLGRVSLNQATLTSFDEYGGLSKDQSEPGLLDNAYNDFQAYLKAYPQGRYAASARGLLRRVYWLGQDQERLTNEYAVLFRQPATKGNSFPDLVQEIDIKLLADLKTSDRVNDPMLLATLNLRAMRRPDDPKMADYGTPPITRAALDAQRSKFAGNEALFGYLQAVHAFYVANNAAEVLKLIPASTSTDSSYLGFSRQLLRTLALDASGNAAARPALVALVAAATKPHQRGSAELALAMHYERARTVENVFATNSAIRDPEVREILLRYTAGPSLLRRQAVSETASEREQRVALYTLLYKQLTRGDYADFLRNAALVPSGAKPLELDDYRASRYTDLSLFDWAGSKEFACPSIRSVATTLSAKPKDARSLLCLGEFVRLNWLDPDFYGVTYALDELPRSDELGGTPSLFPGTRFSRLGAYKAVAADAAAGPENRAYALYRAVNCYAPSAYNACDSTEHSKAQRKAWFDQLKGQYPTSVWAKKLRYYW
jgi:hypothetical protein